MQREANAPLMADVWENERESIARRRRSATGFMQIIGEKKVIKF